MAILGTPILFTVTSSTTLKEKRGELLTDIIGWNTVSSRSQIRHHPNRINTSTTLCTGKRIDRSLRGKTRQPCQAAENIPAGPGARQNANIALRGKTFRMKKKLSPRKSIKTETLWKRVKRVPVW